MIWGCTYCLTEITGSYDKLASHIHGITYNNQRVAACIPLSTRKDDFQILQNKLKIVYKLRSDEQRQADAATHKRKALELLESGRRPIVEGFQNSKAPEDGIPVVEDNMDSYEKAIIATYLVEEALKKAVLNEKEYENAKAERLTLEAILKEQKVFLAKAREQARGTEK
jgi:hypothetical protein